MRPGSPMWHRSLNRISREFRAVQTTRGSFPTHVDNQANAAVVVLADGTEKSYPRCTVSMFEHDEVTVSSLDDNEPIVAVWKPGTWRHATAYDANGYSLVGFAHEQ